MSDRLDTSMTASETSPSRGPTDGQVFADLHALSVAVLRREKISPKIAKILATAIRSTSRDVVDATINVVAIVLAFTDDLCPSRVAARGVEAYIDALQLLEPQKGKALKNALEQLQDEAWGLQELPDDQLNERLQRWVTECLGPVSPPRFSSNQDPIYEDEEAPPFYADLEVRFSTLDEEVAMQRADLAELQTSLEEAGTSAAEAITLAREAAERAEQLRTILETCPWSTDVRRTIAAQIKETTAVIEEAYRKHAGASASTNGDLASRLEALCIKMQRDSDRHRHEINTVADAMAEKDEETSEWAGKVHSQMSELNTRLDQLTDAYTTMRAALREREARDEARERRMIELEVKVNALSRENQDLRKAVDSSNAQLAKLATKSSLRPSPEAVNPRDFAPSRINSRVRIVQSDGPATLYPAASVHQSQNSQLSQDSVVVQSQPFANDATYFGKLGMMMRGEATDPVIDGTNPASCAAGMAHITAAEAGVPTNLRHLTTTLFRDANNSFFQYARILDKVRGQHADQAAALGRAFETGVSESDGTSTPMIQYAAVIRQRERLAMLMKFELENEGVRVSDTVVNAAFTAAYKLAQTKPLDWAGTKAKLIKDAPKNPNHSRNRGPQSTPTRQATTAPAAAAPSKSGNRSGGDFRAAN